jgi:uncharacterized protein YndB with AHSA1/START domain
MRTERTGTEAGKALFEVRLDGTCAAPAEAVFGLLVDLEQHLEWGGRSQKKKFRLASMEAPPGPASVGTEFQTTGIDPSGSFTDTSVVTEAIRPEVFEFVTEARLQPKRGEILEWTNVHRYELARNDEGCRVLYTLRVMRLSRRPWWTKGWAKGTAQKISASYARGGLANLVRMAEVQANSAR